MESECGKLVSLDNDRGALQFNYDAYEPSIGKFLKSQADRIQRYVRTSAIQIGKDLIAGKRYLSHGEFHNWVVREVGIPIRTAQAYMQVAQWASGKSATVTNLPPSLLYALSARSTPKEFSVALLERIEAGAPVTPSFVREQLVVLRKMKTTSSTDTNVEMANVAIYVSDTQPVADHHCRYAVQEAISIICRGLRTADFERVKSIMTQEAVLRDPTLNQKIALAFDTVNDAPVSAGSIRLAGPVARIAAASEEHSTTA